MELPINFPKDSDVIAADAARFRSLSPMERSREIGRSLRLYRFLKQVSGNPERIERFAEEEERRDWHAVQEFVSRHA